MVPSKHVVSFIVYLDAFAWDRNYLFFVFVFRKDTHYRVISSHTSLLNSTCKIATTLLIENYLCLAQLVMSNRGCLLHTVCAIAKLFDFAFKADSFICMRWTWRSKNLATISSTNRIISKWLITRNHRV